MLHKEIPIILIFIGFGGLIIFLVSLISSKTVVSVDKKDKKAVNKYSENTNFPTTCDNICHDWLEAHNKYRRVVGYTDLIWDSDFAKQSKDYAEQLNNSGEFKHGNYNNKKCVGPDNNCGQNLEKVTYYGNSNITTNSKAVDNWYNECSNYTKIPINGNDMNGPKFGHYTQIMWKNAKKVGCASVGGISACLYDVGNILGEFEYNVPVPGNQCNTIKRDK